MAFSSDRRGSALLIVLGMVAFMVVSAVGFSIYMRQSRMPSSMLRRTTSAHELARAALAEAMASIEAAIGDYAAPGVGGTTQNSWVGRVLTPGGTAGMLDPSQTVSTFALESLAYMPPALVNDIRYYGRRTQTAAWNRLDFDAGRSAFCAVNVSDYFDLNRVSAGVPRGSGDDNLVTLSYLFQNGTYTGFAADPLKFQDFLDDVEDSAEGSFASLADYNLALASLGSGTGLTSPFVEFLKRGTGLNGFYGFTRPDENSADFRKVALQRFVTDGNPNLTRDEWLTDTSSGEASSRVELDISDPKNQPFPDLMKKDDQKSNDDTAYNVSSYNNEFWDKYADYLGPLESLALYDYLDADDVPISVVAPTVERAPMLVGIEANGSDLKLSVEEKEVSTESNDIGGGIYEERKVVDFCLKLSGSIDVNAGFAFPFKWQKERNASAGNFSAVAQAAFYMISEDSVAVAGQTGRQGCAVKVDGALKDWPTKGGEGTAEVRDGGVVVLTSSKGTTKLPGEDVDTEDKAVSKSGGQFRDVQLSIDSFQNANGRLQSDYPVVRYYLYRKYRKAPGMMTETPIVDWCLEEEAGIEGARKTEYKMQALDFSTGDLATGAAGKFTWGLGLTVTLKNNDGKLVDMAPAHALDDDTPPEGIGTETRFRRFKRGLLRFDNKDANLFVDIQDGYEGYNTLHEKVAANELKDKPIDFKYATYLTDDPRYNFAASNWYPVSAPGGSLGEAWLAKKSCDGANGKEGDIFMSVSNQGYLQDAGEIAFIPRVCDFRSVDSDCKAVVNAMESGKIPAGAGDCANASQMWRTFGCFGDLGANAEVDSLGMTSPVNGFRINPYTDDDTIRLGAFINTPYDWWSAGTNYVKDAVKKTFADEDGRVSDMTKPLKYTFGPSGTGNAKIEAEDLKEFSKWMGTKLRSATDGKWWKKWDEIGWLDGEIDEQLGVTLHDVDRKFLHNYWRKCFANQQQLFLVFFRAEPVVLGGGSGQGTTPAQLGAKGVAVVWRDPRYKEAGIPHSMRVLFYHQVN